MASICFFTSGCIRRVKTPSISRSKSINPSSLSRCSFVVISFCFEKLEWNESRGKCAILPLLLTTFRSFSSVLQKRSWSPTPRSVPLSSKITRGLSLIFTERAPEWIGNIEWMSKSLTDSAENRLSWKYISNRFLNKSSSFPPPGQRSSIRGSCNARTCWMVTMYWGCLLRRCWNLSRWRFQSWLRMAFWISYWRREQEDEGKCRVSFAVLMRKLRFCKIWNLQIEWECKIHANYLAP